MLEGWLNNSKKKLIELFRPYRVNDATAQGAVLKASGWNI